VTAIFLFLLTYPSSTSFSLTDVTGLLLLNYLMTSPLFKLYNIAVPSILPVIMYLLFTVTEVILSVWPIKVFMNVPDDVYNVALPSMQPVITYLVHGLIATEDTLSACGLIVLIQSWKSKEYLSSWVEFSH